MSKHELSNDIMQATLREGRMVVERLCQSVGVPDGVLRSVTDCGVYSAALGLSGYAGLERQLELLRRNLLGPMTVHERGRTLVFDGAGQHAWFAADPALDVLVAAYRLNGEAEMVLTNVVEPEELRVIEALAEKHGLNAELRRPEDGGLVVRLSDRNAEEPTVLDKVTQEGISVPTSLWFHLFHRSHDALAADTIVSRTHTGSIIVKPDGTIVGKEDPEFIDMDLTMLTAEALVEPKFVQNRRGGS